MNKLKNFLQKKVYVRKIYNQNYPFSYTKHMHYFFIIEVSYDFKEGDHLFIKWDIS